MHLTFSYTIILLNVLRALSLPSPTPADATATSRRIYLHSLNYYDTDETWAPNLSAPVQTITSANSVATKTAPFAVMTATASVKNTLPGDVSFIFTPDGKKKLQSLFEEVAKACSARRVKRNGQCELDYLSRPGVGGGVLDFDLPIDFKVPLITAGDLSALLESSRTTVVVALIAYIIGQGTAPAAIKIPEKAIDRMITTMEPSSTKKVKLAPYVTEQYGESVPTEGFDQAEREALGDYMYTFLLKIFPEEPEIKKSCKGSDSKGVEFNYIYRDAALNAIKNFCKAQDGKILKQNDEKTWIKETHFAATYAKDCKGPGEYRIRENLCREHLQVTVDGCDTDTVVYKHGGTATDIKNCGSFEFSPTGFDGFACSPENKDKKYVPNNAPVPLDAARDAIKQFCNRGSKDETYTLDPSISKPVTGTGEWVANTCVEKGFARCPYRYNNDGKRVTDKGKLGDFVIGLSARYIDADGCGPKQKYEIKGARCEAMLEKIIGKCAEKDKDKHELGSLLESGENGCVVWDIWGSRTS